MIDVPGAPPIPGLTFRRFRGEADYSAIVSILDACNVADEYVCINTVEDVASTFAHLRNCIEMVCRVDAPRPEAPLPPGLEVRPVAPEQYRAVWDAKEEARQDHWGYGPTTDSDFARWIEIRAFTPHLWKVAWDGDQVAGMVLNRLDVEENAQYHRQRGYAKEVFVRRPWRRRGLARSLLVQSIEMFKVMGMEEVRFDLVSRRYGYPRCA